MVSFLVVLAADAVPKFIQQTWRHFIARFLGYTHLITHRDVQCCCCCSAAPAAASERDERLVFDGCGSDKQKRMYSTFSFISTMQHNTNPLIHPPTHTHHHPQSSSAMRHKRAHNLGLVCIWFHAALRTLDDDDDDRHHHEHVFVVVVVVVVVRPNYLLERILFFFVVD